MQNSLKNQIVTNLFCLYPELRSKVIDKILDDAILDPKPFIEDAAQTALHNFIPMAIGFDFMKFNLEKEIEISQDNVHSFILPNGKKYLAKVKLGLDIEDITPPEPEPEE